MISFPSPSQVLVDVGQAMSRQWNQWFREWHAGCGFSPSVEVHRDLTVMGVHLNLDVGLATLGAVLGNIYLPEYPAKADTDTTTGFRMPNDYREGSAVKPWLEWSPNSDAAGDVYWRWEYLWMRDGTPIDTGTTLLNETSAAPLLTDQPTRVVFDEVTGDIKRGDNMAVCIWRLGATDTYAAAARIISCGLKYVADGLGTTEVHP